MFHMSDWELITVTCSCGYPVSFILDSSERVERACDACGASLSAERQNKDHRTMTTEFLAAIELLRESRDDLVRTVREELTDPDTRPIRDDTVPPIDLTTLLLLGGREESPSWSEAQSDAS